AGYAPGESTGGAERCGDPSGGGSRRALRAGASPEYDHHQRGGTSKRAGFLRSLRPKGAGGEHVGGVRKERRGVFVRNGRLGSRLVVADTLVLRDIEKAG